MNRDAKKILILAAAFIGSIVLAAVFYDGVCGDPFFDLFNPQFLGMNPCHGPR